MAQGVLPFETILHTEFRDGNVPAGSEQLRVFKEALDCLPEEVKQVRLGFWSAVSEFRRKFEDERIEISDRDFEGLRNLSSGREVELRR